MSRCLLIKAAMGDEKCYETVLKAMRYNWKFGSGLIVPCECDPPCPSPSEKQKDDFNNRILSDLNEPERIP